MPFFSYSCTACGHRQQELRQVDAREADTVCEVCRAPSSFFPFGSAPAMRMDDNYHRATSSDGRAWDRIIGHSADAGKMKLASEFQAKNRIIKDGKVPVFRQDKSSYRPATGFDIPQMVTNRIGATHPGVRQEIKEGRVKNDLVPPKT